MRTLIVIFALLATAATAHAALNAFLSIAAVEPLDTIYFEGEAWPVDGLVSDGKLHPVTHLVDGEDFRERGFAGSVVLTVDKLVPLEALAAEGETFPLEMIAKVPTGGAQTVILMAPDGIMIATIDLP